MLVGGDDDEMTMMFVFGTIGEFCLKLFDVVMILG